MGSVTMAGPGYSIILFLTLQLIVGSLGRALPEPNHHTVEQQRPSQAARRTPTEQRPVTRQPIPAQTQPPPTSAPQRRQPAPPAPPAPPAQKQGSPPSQDEYSK